jgi:hypothetical protein
MPNRAGRQQGGSFQPGPNDLFTNNAQVLTEKLGGDQESERSSAEMFLD